MRVSRGEEFEEDGANEKDDQEGQDAMKIGYQTVAVVIGASSRPVEYIRILTPQKYSTVGVERKRRVEERTLAPKGETTQSRCEVGRKYSCVTG